MVWVRRVWVPPRSRRDRLRVKQARDCGDIFRALERSLVKPQPEDLERRALRVSKPDKLFRALVVSRDKPDGKF